MSDSTPSVVSMLEKLEKTPPKPTTEDEKFKHSANALSDEERLHQVIEWQQQGIPVKAIAKIFDVAQVTIRAWIRKARKEFRQSFEGETAADNLAGHLMFLQHIQEMCLYEANQAGKDAKEFDPKTGKISDKKNSYGKGTKIKFTQMAMQARKMEIDLLVTTGVLPTEPGRMYHSLEEEGVKEAR